MQENRISITISPEDNAKVKAAIDTLHTTLAPFLVALNPNERRTLPKVSDGTLPFVQKALEYAQTNAQFVPAYVDVAELKTDVDAVSTLLQFLRPLEQLFEILDDTVMLSGSEAYVAALAFYNSVKQATKMKVPGAEPIYNDLLQRFDGQGKKKAQPAETLK